MPIPMMVAYAAAPTVVPLAVGALVFIVMAIIAVSIGVSEKWPGWMTFMAVVASGFLAGWAYRSVRMRMGHTSVSPSSMAYNQPKSVQSSTAPEARANVSLSGGLSPPKIPDSIKAW